MCRKTQIICSVFGIGMTLILCLVLGLSILTSSEVEIASAATVESSAEELCKTYTDSDTIYGTQLTIRDYPTKLLASTVSFPQNSKNKMNVSGDDPIVKIIPRKYFIEVGKHFYIGKEYGFFVDTQTWGYYTENKLSTILVFDITTNTNLEQTIDRLIVRVEPIFQYFFVYVDCSSKHFDVPYSETYFDCDGISTSGNIIAVPNSIQKFEQCERYYLKDISFGVALYNEQELNTINTEYKPEQDYGSFITMYDYVYSGVKRSANGVDPSSLGEASVALSIVSTFFGVASLAAPPLGAISMLTGAIGTAIGIADTYGVEEGPANVTAANGKITATCKYTTKREQLAHYVDEQTRKPALTKAASIIINGDDEEGNLWYNVGSYAEGYFTISDSATVPWYTRYIQEIALSVVDVNGNEHVKQGLGSSTYMLHNPIDKTAGMGGNELASFLPNGTNYFTFRPDFSGVYNINLDKQYNYTITVYDRTAKTTTTITPQNNVYKYSFVAERAYDLQIFSPLGDVARLNIMPSGSSTVQSIAGNSESIYSYTSTTNKTVQISSSQANAPITAVYKKIGDGGYGRLLGATSLSTQTEMYMIAGETYYFILNNKTSTALSARVNMTSFIRLIDPSSGTGASLSMSANDNYRYYTFTPSVAGDYHFTFENSKSSAYEMSFLCIDKDRKEISASKYRDGYLILYGLKANTTYYIGVASTVAMTVTPKYTRTNAQFVWKYYDGGTWKNLDKRELELTRGKTYEFGLWINGLKAQNYDIIISSAVSNSFEVDNIKSCCVNFKDNALDYASIVIQAKSDKYKGLNYDNGIIVCAMFDPDKMVVNSINYKNTTSITLSMPTGVITWNAELSGKSNNGSNFTYPYENITTSTLNIYNVLKDKNALGQLNFTITKAVIRSASGNGSREIYMSNSKEVGATYTRKEAVNGKTMYVISNALQFYNIRFDKSYGRIFSNTISLSDYSSWEPIGELTCDIDGNGFSITNYNILVNGYEYQRNYYGLVGTNKATISNLTLENISMSFGDEANPTTWKIIGSFAGVNSGTIQHCYAYGVLYGYRDLMSVGGIVGKNTGLISSCEYGKVGKAQSIVYCWSDVGGICGQNSGTVMDCRTLNARVQQMLYSSSSSAGGIVGYSSAGSSIIRCAVEHSVVENVNNSKVKIKPKMGVIVGHMIEGTIASVGMDNDVKTSTGAIDSSCTANCFNGSWPFYGKLENCTVDSYTNQYGP